MDNYMSFEANPRVLGQYPLKKQTTDNDIAYKNQC